MPVRPNTFIGSFHMGMGKIKGGQEHPKSPVDPIVILVSKESWAGWGQGGSGGNGGSGIHIFAPMNSRILMTASAAMLATFGMVLSFAPEEAVAYLGGTAQGFATVLVQLAGALYLGFAITNWTAKGMMLGGIYGRAIVLGNFLHFTMGALALLKMAAGPAKAPAIWAVAAIYAVFAVLFFRVLFGQPGKAE